VTTYPFQPHSAKQRRGPRHLNLGWRAVHVSGPIGDVRSKRFKLLKTKETCDAGHRARKGPRNELDPAIILGY
jgi:hypothetical protein